ncbi:hypothetical protein LK07_21980 [Streptomyces pluripotens]|uniref:Lipoprotein n=1 Tax=Streptomyces pluripotens TaxID=1355015 RepID=A0A221P1W2_9ACTN|nr:hypothetical protein LK06_020820 [Streptomyces pluripotens]ASN26239.1 hypothetical protein LK07_21980 [Streptomyces pluripotens]KIE26405.1 lipoprotein [Streptomyces sp. MUSC 125]MCH0560749.1 hypothetical protein [Streptomyces sp. MUM 16J]
MRLCATAAVSALSLALITGCSDGESKGSADTGGKEAAKPAAKTLNAAELKKLIIAKGDVPGFKVQEIPGGTPARGTVKAGDPQCTPLLDVLTGLAPAKPAAETNRMAMQDKKAPTDDATSMDDMTDGKLKDAINKSLIRDTTVVALSSYDGDGAEQALKSVSDAVKACASGFKGSQGGTKATFTKVAEEKSSGTGDAAIAFAATSAGDGETAVVHAEVVRHGNALVSYTTINIGAMMAKQAYKVSPAVVSAQAAKLK